MTTEDILDIWKVLIELKSGGDERKEQVGQLFKLFRDHSDEEKEMIKGIFVILERMSATQENATRSLDDYSARCEDTDRALDTRVNALEDDHTVVKGAAKMAVWAATLTGGITALIEIWRFMKG